LNSYKDVIYKINSINKNPSDELLKLIISINEEVVSNNVGKELYSIINEINNLITIFPQKTEIISSKIFMVIHLIKKNYSVIPYETRCDLIETLNNSIRNRNSTLKSKSPHGIIKILKPYSDISYDTAIILHWKCQTCNKIWLDSKSISSDIIAPGICKFCKGYKIINIPWVKEKENRSHKPFFVNIINKIFRRLH